MGGTPEGGRKSAEKLKAEFGEHYFSDLAKKVKTPRGGKNSPGSFDSITSKRALAIRWKKKKKVDSIKKQND